MKFNRYDLLNLFECAFKMVGDGFYPKTIARIDAMIDDAVNGRNHVVADPQERLFRDTLDKGVERPWDSITEVTLGGNQITLRFGDNSFLTFVVATGQWIESPAPRWATAEQVYRTLARAFGSR
jgi:hypothetical protein